MSWKRKGLEKPIELIFKFDTPRKFNKVNIFTANLLHLGIQVRIKKAKTRTSPAFKLFPIH